MATQDQSESTFISRYEVNYYVVYSPSSKSILYVGTRQDCERYVVQSELENSEIWHMHDVEFYAKPVYLINQE
jgi:hypothetical protein